MHFCRSFIMAGLVGGFTLSAFPFVEAAPGEPTDSPARRVKLAPGVETKIPLSRAEEETSAVHDFIEVTVGLPALEWKPETIASTKTLHAKSKDVIFRRGIWQLEFSFKPPRLIRVDIPQQDGKMKSSVVWYMVYRITNPGRHMTPVQAEDEQFHKGKHDIRTVDSHQQMVSSIGPHRFVPTFLLRTFATAELTIDEKTVQYTDQVIPVARRAIYQRERPNCDYEDFFDTVQIGEEPLPVSSGRDETTRWGVVTWMNIDPKIDYFTVQIMGLTNAYKWVDPPGVFKPGDPPGTGRQFVYKTLQLNFYRPGDALDQREEEIILGVEGHPKYQWLYRHAPTTYVPVHPRS